MRAAGSLPLGVMLAVHVVEAAVMARRLARHSVPVGSALWAMWVGSTFLEGAGAFERLNALIEEGEKKEH
ncbi:hypothetical protein BDY21DRAFT_334756 [Lineolata rhizophorae]|uniref:Uncharacterized protein n=1 Tax=Lineolata rhizophorae TaxID=578093 RepID=A0A6A6P9T1_9PEZI|nr:hypothetical protein BDY21DRAFT_334756 [Lineolata rhizophorae]